MLRLADQIGCNEFRICRFVGYQQNLTGACDRVNIHMSKNGLFRKCDEQVSWPDNFINRLDATDSKCKRSNSLGTSNPIYFGNTQNMAGGKQFAVVSPKFRRGHHHGDLFDASGLGRHHSHDQT